MSISEKRAFHAKSIPEVFSALETSADGLSSVEAKKRLMTAGPNLLPTTGAVSSRVKVFFSQWKSPLIIILFIAGTVSGILREFTDMTIIYITVFANALIGFVQEDKANQALKKLQSLIEFKALVLRDGKKTLIKSQEIVPGDVLFVTAGDKIQADGRVIRCVELLANEASLTGESVPVKKEVKDVLPADTSLSDRVNMLFGGTTVTNGEGTVLVTGTGAKTEIGTIALLVQSTEEEETPLQTQLSRLAKQIGWVVIVIAMGILAVGIFFRNGSYTVLELFETAIAVAVAAIPEGLVISLTVILAIGMQFLLKKNALVRRLVAAETLGSVSVICTDKTGTLTLGVMRVTQIVTWSDRFNFADMAVLRVAKEGHHKEAALLIRAGVLANNGSITNPEVKDKKDLVIVGDTTDAAIAHAGMRIGIEKHHLDAAIPRVGEIPFTSERKYMATLHQVDHQSVMYAKGAPEVMLAKATLYEREGKQVTLDSEALTRFEKDVEALTKEGLRVLAVGYKIYPGDKHGLGESDMEKLVLVGLMGLSDPIREDVPDTIRVCHKAGIRVIMVTGDHADTAVVIGKILGLAKEGDTAIEGAAIETMSDAEAVEALKRTNIFARVDPKHKIRIIKALQGMGEVVAMTGDGVNDAPALKAADVGVAIGSGTDVAKEMADLVLLDDSFTTIVAAIEEGRRIYHNIRKVILYLLAGSFSEIVLIVGSIIMRLPLAILPAQILWVNIIEDSFPNIALAFDKGEKDSMLEPPRREKKNILDADMKAIIAIISVATNVVLFGLFLYFLRIGTPIERVRTIMFAALGMGSMFFIYSTRSRHAIWLTHPFDNHYLTATVLFGIGLLVSAVYVPVLQTLLKTVPLGLGEWTLLVGFGFANTVIIEAAKFIRFRWRGYA